MNDLEEIVESLCSRDAICTKGWIFDVVDRPRFIEDDQAIGFFGGEKGDADQSQG